MGYRERKHTEQRCAQLPEGSAEWFAENCDTMEQPGLVWLLLLLGIYLLIAMATARMYRRYRAKNEALWEEAKANGPVKIEIDEEEATGGLGGGGAFRPSSAQAGEEREAVIRWADEPSPVPTPRWGGVIVCDEPNEEEEDAGSDDPMDTD